MHLPGRDVNLDAADTVNRSEGVGDRPLAMLARDIGNVEGRRGHWFASFARSGWTHEDRARHTSLKVASQVARKREGAGLIEGEEQRAGRPGRQVQTIRPL